jgi:hypothetical protein
MPVFSPLQARWYPLFTTNKEEKLMRGVIVHVEHRIGWIAIRDDRGEITIAEILGGYDVEKGTSSPVTSILTVVRCLLTRQHLKVWMSWLNTLASQIARLSRQFKDAVDSATEQATIFQYPFTLLG